MKILSLGDRSLIDISGKDRLEFLQGLITVDIHKATQNHALWAGILSPQGKALFDFFIYITPDNPDTVLIDIHTTRTDDFINHLQKYILRSDVKIHKNDGLHIIAIWEHDTVMFNDYGFAFGDPRGAVMGYRLITNTIKHDDFIETHKNNLVTHDDYVTLRIDNIIADPAVDMPNMDYYWLEINAESLNGVDYKKGCYVGQEVTARMKHKTELKRQVIPVYVMGNPETPAIMATDIKEIGTLLCVDSWTGRGLAYVYLNRWEDAIETLRSVTVDMCMITKVS